MKKILLPLLYSLLTLTAFGQQTTPRRLEILFLGDNGHHRPIERVPALMSALGVKGYNFTYSDQLEDLNASNLAKFDALMLYANWDSIAKPEEKALLDFVAAGKGFVAVHCATYCFRNSDELVKMMGGQFQKHTWDTIQPVWTRPNHPAMMGVQQFKTLDETYLHTKLQADNLVLTERLIQPDQAKDRPNQKTEPYTWVRNYGKGRVFYTAYGHDENTWNKPEFIDLLEKGIRWAVGDNAIKNLEALDLKSLNFAEAKLPNYEQRPGPQLRQAPLSPDESRKYIQVPPDFTLETFAHEPDVMHPIAMAWDERGRLFVLITKDYPNERKTTGGSDYILICEDTNADGKADKFTRFAEGLSIPTGMVFANGGLIVSQAPDMLFLKDTNGDDKADERSVLFSGFGTGDTHAGPSNLHYGFDNWIWGCVGYSGYKGKLKNDADTLSFGQALFRFRPDGSKMEWITSTSNNTWGMGFNEAGDVFGSTANNAHGWYVAIPHRYFSGKLGMGQDNGGHGTDTHKDMKTITPRVRQVDVFGGYTAAAGQNFYTARAFPKQYWNQIAFVSEPTGHVLHQNLMVKNGTDYQDKEAFNLLAGADEWVAPVFAEVGPDGAVWVADWYSFIIQHNPKPDGFNMGVGNAYETDLRDYTHGRLYRIAYKQAPVYQPITLSKNSPDELLAALKNDNLFWRNHAQRLLVERGQTDVKAKLIDMVLNQSVDELGLNVGAIHALWTLQGLGLVETDAIVQGAVVGALNHPSAAVRKTAVQILPNSLKNNSELLIGLLNDKEPLVVLNSLLRLTEIKSLNPEAEKVILNRMNQTTDTKDHWLPDAFSVVLTAHGGKLLKQYIGQKTVSDKVKNLTAIAPQPMHNHHEMAKPSNQPIIKATTKGTDLAITNISIEPATVSVREYARITLEISNLGSIDFPKGKSPLVNIWIEGAGLKTAFVSRKLTNGIAAGQTVKLTEGNNGPWNSPFGFSSEQGGEVTIKATIDAPNEVVEADESKNNTLSQKFEVKKPATFSDFVLERAARSYASNAAPDSVLSLIRMANSLGTDSRVSVLKGIANGWNGKRKEAANETDKTLLVSIKNSLSDNLKTKFGNLAESFGVMAENNPDLQRIKIKSVKEMMQYDVKEFVVKAGKPVELTFENPDAMQHNLLIIKPKSLETIGKASDKMITQRDAAERNYVPNLPQYIIASTPLVNPNQSYTLTFTAPTEVGNYPFVCTFPGHWRLMKGVMKVVK